MQNKAERPEGHRSVNMVLGAINISEPKMQQWQGGWRKGQVPKRWRKKTGRRPGFCSWLPRPYVTLLAGPSAASRRGARTARPPTPGRRSAPAAVAFLKGQVLRTRGRGLESCARAMPSTNGRRRKGRFDFRAIAERPAEQREKSPSQPRAQRASTRKVSAS